ncbi:MAG: sigma-70 family RNA polymerase sigma factor, partial [Planctomycetes bacterium]|nr:sigma-70 family RNA polymerase sigma factor [Planctomycetota bacterium]
MQRQLENISIDDAVLVRRCQQGDSEATERLIVKYQDRIYNVILKICRNRDDAAELTQETFVKVIEKIDSFRGKSAFYTWLFRVAVNLTLNYCKRRFKVSGRSLDEPCGPDLDGTRGQLRSFLVDESAIDPAVLAQKKEIGQIVFASLSRLDDDHRIVLVLRDIEDMAYAEIAEVL